MDIVYKILESGVSVDPFIQISRKFIDNNVNNSIPNSDHVIETTNDDNIPNINDINVSDISGKIRFSNPSIRQHYPIDGYDSPLFFMYTDFKPENHKILIFPSWISHEVFPSPDSDEDRVSLSFNITQIKI